MDYFDYHISLQNSFSHKMQDLLGEPRNPFIPLKPEDKNFQKFADIAKGAQVATTKLLCKIFEHAYKLTGSKEFLFSGGVAMNSASLEQLADLPFVDNICIPPSPGDSGSAIGSAFYSFLKDSNNEFKDIYKPSLFPSLYNSKKHKTINCWWNKRR